MRGWGDGRGAWPREFIGAPMWHGGLGSWAGTDGSSMRGDQGKRCQGRREQVGAAGPGRERRQLSRATLYKKNIKADGLHACRLARIWCRLLFRAYGASPLRPAARISTQRHRKHTNQHEQSSGNTEHVQGHVPSQRVRRENQRALCCAARQTVLIGVLLVQCWAGEPEQRMMSSHWNE